MRPSILPILALSVMTAACEPEADPFLDVLPDERLLVEQNADASQLMRSLGDPSHYAVLTANLIDESNAWIGEVLAMVDAITDFPPTFADDSQSTVLWGPWLDNGTYGQLWVQEQDDGSYVWAIEVRPEDSADDAWTPVLGGEVDAGATDTASTGRFGIDLTAISAADGGDTTGQLAVDYALRESGATTTVYVGELSEGDAIPADAATHFDYDEGVGGTMDVIIHADVSEPSNGSEETAIIRTRWTADGEGRGDAYLTGGDLGGLTYTETECWGGSQGVVFYQNNFLLEMEGEESACVFEEPSFNEEEA